MMLGSKATPSRAAEIVRCETPAALASFLIPPSQVSKVPLWELAAKTGPGEAVQASKAAVTIKRNRENPISKTPGKFRTRAQYAGRGTPCNNDLPQTAE